MNVKKLKKSKATRETIKKYVLECHKKYNHKIPSDVSKEIAKSYQLDELVEGGCRCYRIHPNKKFNGTYIFYLYGGFMCLNISPEQWRCILDICKKTGSGVIIPMYPLAPEFSCKETFKMLMSTYSNLTMSYDVKKLVLMGDSSGAGLALSMAMIAWQEGYRKPDQLILISPLIDTEFFDRDIEEELFSIDNKYDSLFYSEAAKDFINTYWVKDYAVKTDYTSPYYEDYTDICDDIVVFSGLNDMFNCYARAFYRKAKKQGVNVRFFEYEDENHFFMFRSKTREAKSARAQLLDVFNNTYNNSLNDIYPIKLLSDWTKRYPEIVSDEWATKFIYANKFDFSSLKTKTTQYRNILMAANVGCCDEKVKKFILQYPNCTVINVGCKLDNMFGRMDNGRIQWYNVDNHNIMSVRRTMYGEREREKTVGRDFMDFSWMDEIRCRRNKGIMIVCNHVVSRLKKHQFKLLLEKLYDKFPGAEVVFTASTTGSAMISNMKYKSSFAFSSKERIAINDAHRMLGEWKNDYKLISEEPTLKYAKNLDKVKLFTRIGIKYNIITYNHKLIHIRLGGELYEIMV